MRKGLKNIFILLLGPLTAACTISGQGSSSPAGSGGGSSLTDPSSTPPSPSKDDAIEELKDSADRFIEGYGFLLLANGEEATAYSTSGDEVAWLFDTPMGDWSKDKYNILTLHTSLEEVIATFGFPRFNGLSGVASVDYLEDGGEVFRLTFNSDLLLIQKQRIDYADGEWLWDPDSPATMSREQKLTIPLWTEMTEVVEEFGKPLYREISNIDYAVYSSPKEPGGKILLHLTFTQGHIFAYGGFNEETDDPEIVEIPDVPDWPLE